MSQPLAEGHSKVSPYECHRDWVDPLQTDSMDILNKDSIPGEPDRATGEDALNI